MLRDQLLELRYELGVPASLEVVVDALLQRNETELFQTRDLVARERFVREVGERRAAPES